MLTGHADNLRALAVSDKLLVTGSWNHTIRVWEWEEGLLGLPAGDRKSETLRLHLRRLEAENRELKEFL